MGKAAFFRNLPNYSVLCNFTLLYKGIVAEYEEIACVTLDSKKFEEFSSNFQKEYDFLMTYIDQAIVQHDIWKCVQILHQDKKILVVMNHYQYPRYLALTSYGTQGYS